MFIAFSWSLFSVDDDGLSLGFCIEGHLKQKLPFNSVKFRQMLIFFTPNFI